MRFMSLLVSPWSRRHAERGRGLQLGEVLQRQVTLLEPSMGTSRGRDLSAAIEISSIKSGNGAIGFTNGHFLKSRPRCPSDVAL